MRHLASSIAVSLMLRGAAPDDRAREEAWRELHRRPDALPDPVEPADGVRPYRRFKVSGFVVRRHGTAVGEG
jgi:hypothetical protein